MAHSQPWILHLVAGPALDQELFAPSAAASATSLPDSISLPSGRSFTSLTPTLCPCPAAPRAAVSPVLVFPPAAPLQPVASRAGGSACPIYPPGLGLESRATPPPHVQPASPAAPRAASPRAPVSPSAFSPRARAPSGSSAAYDTPIAADSAELPEFRPGPQSLSLPELLRRVHRPDPTPAPATPPRADGKALAVAALTSLPLGLRLWLSREGLTSSTLDSFLGLALLPAHLSVQSFASPAERLASIGALLVSHGVDHSFLSLPELGIHHDWGRSVYNFDDDVSALTVVLAAVDQFVTLCDGPYPSQWMVYDPRPRFTEPLDWVTGMPHRPRERAAWKCIPGARTWALRMLKHRFYAKPTVPVRGRISKNSRALRRYDPAFDVRQFEFVQRKLSEEIQHQVVELQGSRPTVTSAILCVPKEGSAVDSFRKVENMSNLKENFDPQRFKLETMQQFPTVFGPRSWLFKLDFKAAYHNFVVRRCMRQLFGIEFCGKYYTYRALPFGFRLSAYWLNKMVKVVATFLRSQGYAILPYMDDGIYGDGTFVKTVRYRNYAVPLWQSLGLRFSPSDGKCVLTPTQSLEGLGVVAHLAAERPTFHMPTRKVVAYRAESRALLELPDLVPVLKLARIAGLLMSAALAIPVSKLLCRPLFACMYSKPGDSRSQHRQRMDWDSLVKCSVDARHELTWLLSHVVAENARGAPIWLDTATSLLSTSQPDWVLSQDASRRGAGWLVHHPGTPALTGTGLAVLIICWEYCAGSGSGSLDFLLENESNSLAVVFMVDILPMEQATRHIPRRFLAAGRVLYYCARAEEIVDIARFETLVASQWPSATLLHLVKMIITPPCTTLSTASRFLDCYGMPGHPTRPDGVNGPNRLPAALSADRFRAFVSVVARNVADALPDTARIVIENPVGLYRHTVDATMLLDHQASNHSKRWRLVTLCHCLHADDGVPTSSKPTDYLCFGYGYIPSESCSGACPLSIPGTALHRYVISNSSRDPRQQRLEGHLRERVPRGVYRYIDSFADAFVQVDSSFVSAAVAHGTVRFTPSESSMYQAALELYGLAMSFRAASTDARMRNKRFRVRVDAMVTVWYFKNSGGRSILLNKVLRFLWEQLRAVGSTIVDMVHVPGSTFVSEGTDLLSRPPAFPENTVADRDNWRLELSWFQRVQVWAGCTFAADLFADRDNHRLPVFFSAAVCAEASGVPDCFANQWPLGVLYAFPPLHLIPRLVQHASTTDAEIVILVPDWPSQPWWPKLMSITTKSLFIGRRPDLFLRRAQTGDSWGYVPVARPFFELRVVRVHASKAAALSVESADPSSGLRLMAAAASASISPVPRMQNACYHRVPTAPVPPM